MIVLVYIASQPMSCQRNAGFHSIQMSAAVMNFSKIKECAGLGIYLCFLDQKLKFELEHPVELEFLDCRRLK
jgi:hypothetical protein